MSKLGILSLLAVLACAASVCVPAHAQNQGAIEGIVLDENGKPLAGVEIRIRNLEHGAKYKTKTDKNGFYYHGLLAWGQKHNVTLIIKGVEPVTVEGVEVGQGRTRGVSAGGVSAGSVVDFNLQKFVEREQAAEAGIEVGKSGKFTEEQRRQIEQQLEKKRIGREKKEKLNQAFGDGMEALSAGNLEVAIAHLKEAAQFGPEQVAVFENLGEAYMRAGRSKSGTEARALFQKSAAAHEKAKALSPNECIHRVRLGVALANASEFQRAEEELSKCAELDPATGAKHMYNLGALLSNDGRSEDSIRAFRKAAKLDPSFAPSWYQIGVYLVPAAKVDETGKSIPAPGTLESLEKYLELAPDGRFADHAKSLVAAFAATVELEFKAEKKKKR